jgi:hypothetical protein
MQRRRDVHDRPLERGTMRIEMGENFLSAWMHDETALLQTKFVVLSRPSSRANQGKLESSTKSCTREIRALERLGFAPPAG